MKIILSSLFLSASWLKIQVFPIPGFTLLLQFIRFLLLFTPIVIIFFFLFHISFHPATFSLFLHIFSGFGVTSLSHPLARQEINLTTGHGVTYRCTKFITKEEAKQLYKCEPLYIYLISINPFTHTLLIHDLQPYSNYCGGRQNGASQMKLDTLTTLKLRRI